MPSRIAQSTAEIIVDIVTRNHRKRNSLDPSMDLMHGYSTGVVRVMLYGEAKRLYMPER